MKKIKILKKLVNFSSKKPTLWVNFLQVFLGGTPKHKKIPQVSIVKRLKVSNYIQKNIVAFTIFVK